MNVKSFTRLVIAAVLVGFVLAGPARADRKQLQEKLNRNISIKLDDVTIAEALETMGAPVGGGSAHAPREFASIAAERTDDRQPLG